ncbi:hypothetical protein Tco_0908828 [Tanacetum coccineum]|uniref:Uncharacterized protein n=1 Tax=Tanacetum coccineum TaxID=301880 RepID=A0ABQ5CNX4_9ASTR
MFSARSGMKVEKYVRYDQSHRSKGSVMASKPNTMQDVNEFATELIIKRSALLLNVKLKIKESLMTLQGTTRTNNNPYPKGINVAHGPILKRLWKENHTEI